MTKLFYALQARWKISSFVSHTLFWKPYFALSFTVQKPSTFDTVNKKWVNFSPSTFDEVNRKWVKLSITSSFFLKRFYDVGERKQHILVTISCVRIPIFSTAISKHETTWAYLAVVNTYLPRDRGNFFF